MTSETLIKDRPKLSLTQKPDREIINSQKREHPAQRAGTHGRACRMMGALACDPLTVSSPRSLSTLSGRHLVVNSSLLHLLRAAAVACIALALPPIVVAAAESDVPSPPREFRAAWIATVSNIDWPSKPGLPSDEQQAELIAILDSAVELNLNAVILQIRPAADALYASEIEPWSPYLTGVMGKAPEPFYDPLEFAVKEAHRRGLQLHVWFNPYRVRLPEAKGEPSPNHASVADADIVRTYGKYLWFDPGEPAAVERFLAVLTDVVKRYDIDGVHLDDYFYPYQIKEGDKLVPFPDDESYARAVEAGEKLGRDDWRRQNVNHLVEGMYKAVKQEKPWVLVGISPFGIWRPGHPNGIAGLDQYDSLYADARKWLREGWVDYFTPQLYWPVDSKQQSYPKLLAWWGEQNKEHRHLWPGNFTSKCSGEWKADELIRQIETTRKVGDASGNVHFSMKALQKNFGGLSDQLKEGLYAEPALVPETTWLGGEKPAKPEVTKSHKSGESLTVQVKLPSGEPPVRWVVRSRRGNAWSISLPAADGMTFGLKSYADKPLPDEVAISAVNRLGQEGPILRIDVTKLKRG